MSKIGVARVTGWIVAGLGIAVVVGCGQGPGSTAGRKFTDEQLKARFAWDLGAETVDVTRYPAAIQKDYTTFTNLCGRCHTTARPLNAPIVSKAQWTRFVHRMHFKAQSKLLTRASANAVVNFLIHDSSVRKVGQRAAYLKEVARLQALYASLEVERARVRLEEGIKAAKDRGYVSP